MAERIALWIHKPKVPSSILVGTRLSTELVKDNYHVQTIALCATAVSWQRRNVTSDNKETFNHKKTTNDLTHYHQTETSLWCLC